MLVMHPGTAVPLGLAATAAACLAYGAGYEVRAFRLRRIDVPLLPSGERPLRILHLSDLHMTPRQRRKREWVRSLAGLDPDLVVNTGDNFGHLRAVPYILDALGPLLERPGVFVFGSNDYYSPELKNPGRYLAGPSTRKGPVGRVPDLPADELRLALQDAGWEYAGNARARLKVDGRVVDVVGVDDPHVRRDRYDEVAGRADPSADLSIGVLHAPYTRVLDRMAADGHQLILAGHTHGGQVRVPFFGALVTNCDLDRSRARGLSRHPRSPLAVVAGRPDTPAAGRADPRAVGRADPRTAGHANPPPAGGADPRAAGQVRAAVARQAWLHVSAGLGTSPFAPVRFACPPEATLLTLVPRS
jgi:uncharacterized protein